MYISNHQSVGIPWIDERERSAAESWVMQNGQHYSVLNGVGEGWQWASGDGSIYDITHLNMTKCTNPHYSDGAYYGAQITGVIDNQNCVSCITLPLDLWDDHMEEMGQVGISPAGVSWRIEHLVAAYRNGNVLNVRLTFMVREVFEILPSIDDVEGELVDLNPVGLASQEWWDARGLAPEPEPVARVVAVVDEVERRSSMPWQRAFWHIKARGVLTDRPWVLTAEPRILPEIAPGNVLVAMVWTAGTIEPTPTERAGIPVERR